jgi:methylmalonyl-CoA mutase
LAVEKKTGIKFGTTEHVAHKDTVSKAMIIPPARVRYLSEISDEIKDYNQLVNEQASIATKLYQLHGALEILKEKNDASIISAIETQINFYTERLTPVSKKLIQHWPEKLKAYQQDFYEYNVRDKVIRQPMFCNSLSGTKISKVILPKYKDWGDVFKMADAGKCARRLSLYCRCIPIEERGRGPHTHVCR